MVESVSPEVDLDAIMEQANAIARLEYQEARDNLDRVTKEYQERTEGWRAIVGRVSQHYSGPLTLADPDNLDAFLERLDEIVKVGLDFEQLNKACEGNELAQSQWKRLLVTLRMVGMDNTAPGDDNE